MAQKLKFKTDKYFQNRKGYSQFYELRCSKCNAFLTNYQKDGKGDLLRIYTDRIIESKYSKEFKVDEKILCPNCKRLIGLGYIYEKENRPAYRLFQDAVKKKPVNFWQNIKFLFWNFLKR